MKPAKYLVLPVILITLVFASTTIVNSQNSQPIFSAQSVSSLKITESKLQNTDVETNISGNIFYLLIINSTFVFPQDINFTGVLDIGCGVGVNLVATPTWQVIHLLYYCPYISSNAIKSAGTYYSSLYVYLNSMYNYTNSNYPTNINFYIHSTFNKPEYKSLNYSINLADKLTTFRQPQSSTTKSQSNSQTLPVNLLFAPLGIIALVEYRKHKK